MCISAILGVAGAAISAGAANKAAKTQERAAEDQIEYAEDTRDLILARYQPAYEQLEPATNALSYLAGVGERPEGFTDFTGTPGYEFRRNEGIEAVDRSAASRGNLFSGATLKDQERFGQGIASQEFGNYLGQLTNLMQAGTGAAGGQATALSNTNQSVNQALGNIGNAGAAGAIAQGNAFSGLMGNLAGSWGYQQAQNQNPLASPGVGQSGSLY